MANQLIYLDNNATTRPHPEVVATMHHYYQEAWGNPTSLHRFGAGVREEIDRVRTQVMKSLGAARPTEIVFTSGGTESNHLAIIGTLGALPEKSHCITTMVEHSSVFKLFQKLEQEGKKVDYLTVDANGSLHLKELEEKMTAQTAIVSIIWANNETGILFPIPELAKICRNRGVPLHVDAVQAFGKIPIDLFRANVDLLSIGAHKFHGPKGVGALYVNKTQRLRPMFVGGTQERGLRAGTENVAGIIGMGLACELALQNLADWEKTKRLRDFLETEIQTIYRHAKIFGQDSPRLPNTSHICFAGLNGEAICLLLSEVGICTATGSTCSAGSLETSHTLKAMGYSPELAKGAVRFSLSRETTEEEIEKTLAELKIIVRRLSS